MISDEQIEGWMSTLRKRGEDWADADAAFKALDESTKAVLSECIADLNEDLSMAKAEQQARRSPKYLEHMRAVESARRAANRARVSYSTYQTFLDFKRSQISLQKAEMGLR